MSPVPGRLVPLDLLVLLVAIQAGPRASKRRDRPREILVTWRRYTTQRRQILLARAISEGGHPIADLAGRAADCGLRSRLVVGFGARTGLVSEACGPPPTPDMGYRAGGGPRFLLGMQLRRHPPSCRACSAFDAPPPGHTNSVTRLTARAILNSLLFRTYPYDLRH